MYTWVVRCYSLPMLAWKSILYLGSFQADEVQVHGHRASAAVVRTDYCARTQETRADKAERGRGRGTRPDRTGHDQTRQRQGSAAPASRAAVRTDGCHVMFSLVEFGLIFGLVKFLGLFIGVLRELFYFIVMVSVCVVGVFW